MQARRKWKFSAFTLSEMMISSAIYMTVLVGVVVAVQICASRIYTLADTKLRATQGARKALSLIESDIRQGAIVYVGNCTNGALSFKPTTTNGAAGNALMVYGTTNLVAPYTLYYLDTNNAAGGWSNNLISCHFDGTSNTLVKLAAYVTNSIIFTAEDYRGNILSNSTANQIFGVTLQFCQWQYPFASTNASGYYQARTKIARR